MFGDLLQKAREMRSKAGAQFTKIDDLERLCVAAAGAMAADGVMEHKEFDMALKVISDRFPVFSAQQVETALSKATRRFESGGKFSNQRAVLRELKGVENHEEAEAIFYAVVDICDASGGIGEAEKPYIRDMAEALRVQVPKGILD
jgi:tellurite resistance protein